MIDHGHRGTVPGDRFSHPRIYNPPTPLDAALQRIAVWLDLEYCVGIAEGPGYFEVLRRLVNEVMASAPT